MVGGVCVPSVVLEEHRGSGKSFEHQLRGLRKDFLLVEYESLSLR